MNKPVDQPLAIAVKYLKVAERTEAELRAHLVGKGVGNEDVERVVAAMTTRHFVSDVRVAEREVELAKGSRKIGREKAKARLLQRGASDDAVDKALVEYDEGQEAANALTLIKTKFKPTDDPNKAARFLVSRGFGEDSIRAALEQVFPNIQF